MHTCNHARAILFTLIPFGLFGAACSEPEAFGFE
jgi:hypothetical protein